MDAMSKKIQEIVSGERQLRMEGASQRAIDDFKEQKRREIYDMQSGQTVKGYAEGGFVQNFNNLSAMALNGPKPDYVPEGMSLVNGAGGGMLVPIGQENGPTTFEIPQMDYSQVAAAMGKTLGPSFMDRTKNTGIGALSPIARDMFRQPGTGIGGFEPMLQNSSPYAMLAQYAQQTYSQPKVQQFVQGVRQLEQQTFGNSPQANPFQFPISMFAEGGAVGESDDTITLMREKIIDETGVDPIDIAMDEGVDPDLFLRLIYQESRGRPTAKSPRGALGYTQLMPATADGLGVDPTNPVENLVGGARYLREQLDEFGSVPLALAAYNAGPNAVKKYGGIPPFKETTQYVSLITGVPFTDPSLDDEIYRRPLSEIRPVARPDDLETIPFIAPPTTSLRPVARPESFDETMLMPEQSPTAVRGPKQNLYQKYGGVPLGIASLQPSAGILS